MAKRITPTKKLFINFLKFSAVLIFIGLFFAAGTSAGYVAALVIDEPIRPAEEIRQQVFKNNLTGFAYFSNQDKNNNNELIGMLRADEDRRFVEFEEIPKYIKDAFLAIEDRDFYDHFGINPKALGRALLQQLIQSDVQTGGSTITQQLAKNTFYSLEKTHERKAKEIFLALRIERILTKDDILTAYINKIPFGKAANLNNVYGIQAAAKGYFNKDVMDLNLAESAFLAGIPQRPTAYSAFNSKGFDEEGYALAKKRQELVLKRMLEEGFISNEEFSGAMTYDIKAAFDTYQKKAYSKYPYLMIEIENRAAEKLVEVQGIPEDSPDYDKAVENAKLELLTGGYKVYTTIDKDIYEAMNSVAQNSENFNKPINYKYDLGNGQKKEVKNAVEEVGATLIHNKTGAILGFVGGRDFEMQQVNHSTAKRQPGSSIKPLLDYGPAIELGKIQPATPIDDIPLEGKWQPDNWNNKYNGRLTAREALNWSYNIPAVKVYQLVGQENGYEFLTKLGFEVNKKRFMQAGLTPAIGTIEISPEKITNAYTTFANGGTYIDAYLINEIVDKEGNVVYKHKSNPHVVFSEQTAYLITDMLRTVITDGTAKTVRQYTGYNRDVAGKTGTTNESRDLWFIGYTPEISLGVWVGYDYPHKIADGLIAKKTWGRMFAEVMKVKPEISPEKEKFKQPGGLVRMEVSRTSGKLPSELTKEAGYLVTDWFNKNHIPTEIDDSLEKARIVVYNDNRYLAKPETPDDMVSTGIFFKREPYVVPEGKGKPIDFEMELPTKEDPRVSSGNTPSPPSSVALTKKDGKIIISWSKDTSENIVGYRVYRSSSEFIGYQKIAAVIQNNTGQGKYSYEDNGATGSESVYYVTAVDVAGLESTASQLVGNTIFDTNPLQSPNQGNGNQQTGADNRFASLPNKPENLQASVDLAKFEIVLTWNANPSEEQVVKYNIYYSASIKGTYQLIGSVNGLSFTHQVIPGGEAFYMITAVNKNGESLPTKAIQVNMLNENRSN